MELPAALAEELPPSPTKAWVYAALFRMHWLAMRFDLAERFEAEALAMADDLGLKGIRANILSARGALRAARGDQAGFDLLEESIRLFEELNMSTSQRPYNNLADAYYNLGDLRESDRGDGADERGVEAFREPRLASLGRQPGDQAPVPRRPLGGGAVAGRSLSPRRRSSEAITSTASGGGSVGASSWLAAMTPARSKRARPGSNVPRSPATRRS